MIRTAEDLANPSTDPINCTGCKYDLPGDCAAKTMGEDGYWHFPEGDCYEEGPE